MKEINVHEFSNGLKDTFRRYLGTANLIADTEPELKEEIWRQLGEDNVFARQPMVTSIPAYKPSKKGLDILGVPDFPTLSTVLNRLNPAEFDLRRELYSHQLKALQKAQQGKNVVVATGTGSGKTECFLLPVLDDAARHPNAGVRTIVVYPMNALANDQMDRLRRLLKDLPAITFGRYTGETPHDSSKITFEELEGIPPNERFTRDQIKQDPPQILLTNFAMLEYLLLRPDDYSIFSHRALRYVVLDEAHTYSGAQGIDIALLMRRLTERYSTNRLQFILTSATLSEDDSISSQKQIVKFASDLTGAEFSAEDVIFGETSDGFSDSLIDVPFELLNKAIPDSAAFSLWLEALDDPARLSEMISGAGLPGEVLSDSITDADFLLFELLRRWLPARKLFDLVSKGSYSIDELAERLWKGEQNNALVVEWLLTLSARARQSPTSPPLIAARFHFFYRGLSGATVCLNANCACRTTTSGSVSRVFLENRTNCDLPCESLLLPLASCFQCGLPVLSIWLSGDGKKWYAIKQSNVTGDDGAKVFLTWDTTQDEKDDEQEAGDAESEKDESVEICVACGAVSLQAKLNSCCPSPTIVRLMKIESKGPDVKDCPRCRANARPFNSIVREFRSGDDAVTAVLAETVMRHLPVEGGSGHLPAGGRKMLAFSDSRQRAAFFAPFLQRTSSESEFSKPLYDALMEEEAKNDGEPVSIEEVAARFMRNLEKREIVVVRDTDEDSDAETYRFVRTGDLTRAEKRSLRREIEITLLKHFCASPRQRTTWTGLGLAYAEIEITNNQKSQLRQILPFVFEKGDELGCDFLQKLLEVFLMKRALHFDDDAISNKRLGKGARVATFHRSLNDSVAGRQRNRWNPYLAKRISAKTISNSYQANIVARFFGLSFENDGEKISEILESLWDALREKVLIPSESGGEYQLKTSRILMGTSRALYVCKACGRITAFKANGLCTMPRCAGLLELISKISSHESGVRNHYRHRVLSDEPMALKVKEHTAQLTNKLGQAYQKKFVNGEINVLSSSTTFEMGVDVGGLKAVLLRNVPPSASSYIQRAGRAGRRRDGAAYAVTYSRFIPHDQFHFHNPEKIIQGKVPVPLINLSNARLAKRHVNSFLLGEFLRNSVGQEKTKTVADFFIREIGDQPLCRLFGVYIGENERSLLTAVQSILPKETGLSADECLEQSIIQLELIFSERVIEPRTSYKMQWDQLTEALADPAADAVKIGRARKSVERLNNELENETIIDFLSAAHWLPSYAFPQDTIRLLVRQDQWIGKMRLERDRDQGISEYAPGAEIIADGKLFKSAGVVRPNQGFSKMRYRYCYNCRRLGTADVSQNLSPTCSCGTNCRINDYIVPTGFQTLIDESVEEPNLFRLHPPSSTAVSMISGATEEQFLEHSKLAGISTGYRRSGELFRANAGYNFQQFRLCEKCGRHFPGNAKQKHQFHDSPWGTKCGGSLFKTNLGHKFETDILQIRFNLTAGNTPPVSDAEFWTSLTSAFVVAATEVLSIPARDLDALFQSQGNSNSSGELVAYDKVPGGAGYVQRVNDQLPSIFAKAYDRTKNCKNSLCGESSSCYTCLRSYQNQFYWDKLNRGRVSAWLEQTGLV